MVRSGLMRSHHYDFWSVLFQLSTGSVMLRENSSSPTPANIPPFASGKIQSLISRICLMSRPRTRTTEWNHFTYVPISPRPHTGYIPSPPMLGPVQKSGKFCVPSLALSAPSVMLILRTVLHTLRMKL